MMPLLPLTAEERDFLVRGPALPQLPPPGLTRALGARLAARLGMPLQVLGVAAAAAPNPLAAPHWRRDALLDNLWLTRRLGGRRVRDVTVPEQAGLTRALDHLLAEACLDGAEETSLRSLSRWLVCWEGQRAELVLELPAEHVDLQRWAREVIRGTE